MEKKKITILINQRPFHFHEETLSPVEFRNAIGASSDYEVWLVMHSPDPEGQLPDDDIQITGPVEIKDGQRYRVVPPGTFGGMSVMLPARLIDEVKALCEGGLTAILTESDGMANVEIAKYQVSSGRYNKPTIDLLLRLPLSYPNGKPDMFWVDEDFVLRDGRVPKAAEVIEAWLGKRRRRFSWHLSSWNPGADNLLTYLEFINNRLAKLE